VKLLGDYHIHTTFSDGKNSVIEMVRSAKDAGLKECAITDHGFGRVIKGLRKKSFGKLVGEIESARSEMPVLVGVEANLRSLRGDIDIPKQYRDKFDIVLCGVHMAVNYTPLAFLTFEIPNLFFRFILHYTPKFMVRRNTRTVQKAIERNHIDVWTHPNKYFKVDVVEISKTCAERGTLVELNGKRISFRPIDFERMCRNGANFIIGSDAHDTRRVGSMTKVEEFLRNCDYDPACIININKTFTEWKNERIHEQNETRDSEPCRRGWFRKHRS